MVVRLCSILLIMLLSLASFYAIASQVMVVDVPKISLSNKEGYVVITFSSQSRVHVVYTNVKGAEVTLFEKGNEGWVEVHLLNDTSVEQMLAFSSSNPLYLNVTIISPEKTSTLARYTIPANTTLQLVLHISPPLKPKKLEFDLIALLTPKLPIWEYAIYLVLFAMFLSAAYLDSRDYKKKHARWGKLDTFSLFVRYGFYASFLSFLLILIGTMASFILYRVLWIEFQASIMDVVMAFIALAVLTVIYGFAKWRGWYDLVDE